jgi:hypothetical protein
MWRWAGRQSKPFGGETIIAQSANFFGGIGVGLVVERRSGVSLALCKRQTIGVRAFGFRACVGVFSL